MSFQIGIQKYKGAPDLGSFNFVKRTTDMFQQVYEFWTENLKGIYSLFIVEEKIKCALK